MKKILSIIILIVVIGVILIFLGFRQEMDDSQIQTQNSEQVNSIEYVNTKYKYSLFYPKSFQLQEWPNDYPSPDIQQIDSIAIYPLNPTASYSPELKLFRWPDYYQPVGTSDMDLLTFATAVRNIQINETNSNIQPSVGELEDTTIGGMEGYRFALTDAFTLKSLDGYEGGYTLVGDHWIYVFEDKQGAKFILDYSMNDAVIDQVFKSFGFIE